MSSKHKISIITPSFNQAQFLERTIDSVLSQGYPNLEYIIVDGGSTDGSKEIIKKYEKYLKWWCSEKDRGQSHAINKGLSFATGEIFNWINSDDYFEDDTFKIVNEEFQNTELKALVGQFKFLFDGGGLKLTESPSIGSNLHQTILNGFIKQQSTFYRLPYIREFLPLEEKIHYSMDLELWWRFLFSLNSINDVKEIPNVLAKFRIHGDSKTSMARLNFRENDSRILHGFAGKWKSDMTTIFEGLIKDNSYIPRLSEIKSDVVGDLIIRRLKDRYSPVYEKVDFDEMKLLIRNLKKSAYWNDFKGEYWFQLINSFPTWGAFKIYRKSKALLGKDIYA